MMNKGIEAIIFDLGGVILNIDYQRTAKAFKELGLTNFDELYTQLQQNDLFDAYETGQITTADFITAIQAISPIALSSEAIVAAWNAMLLDLPAHRLETIQQLRAPYKVFLYSNTNALHELAFNKTVCECMQTPTLAPFFDKVYLSHTIGFRKPNKEGFELILKENNLNPATTLFIDDSPQHIAGASSLGIQTYFLEQGQTLETHIFPQFLANA